MGCCHWRRWLGGEGLLVFKNIKNYVNPFLCFLLYFRQGDRGAGGLKCSGVLMLEAGAGKKNCG